MTAAVIETISVIRPLKLIALICLCVSLLLLVVSLATTAWLSAGHFSTGLFRECTSSSAGPKGTLPRLAPDPSRCHSTAVRGKTYIKATGALEIIGGLSAFLAALCTAYGLFSQKTNRKYMAYRLAMCLTFLAVILQVIGLLVFLICFYADISDWNMPSWDFDWSYGVAWGSLIFMLGAGILLLCDKEEEEIYYKEKTVYTPAAMST